MNEVSPLLHLLNAAFNSLYFSPYGARPVATKLLESQELLVTSIAIYQFMFLICLSVMHLGQNDIYDSLMLV